MSELKLDRGGKMGSVNTEQLKGGIKKENIKDKSMQNIFDSVDVNKDGVLDADEVKQFQEKILDAAGNDTLSAREAKKFLKKNNIKDVDKKDLLNFINELSQSSENIADSKVIDNNGQKTVVIKYKDGSTETIHPNKSSEVATQGENGETITSYYDKDKKLKSKQTVYQNGQKEVSNYDENGELKQIELTGEGGFPVQTIEMENGKPASATIKNGATTESYLYDENGNPVLMSKLENEGIPAKEKRTEYTYNEDGTVTENITEYGKETTRTVKDGKVVSETIKEQGKTTEKAYDENGHTETVNDGKTTSTTTFNNENKKLSQTKVVDGQEYNVEYDGKGNTKVVLQNGESIEALAQKFGCTKQELLEANGGKIRGWAGDDVVVPGELEADDKRLQGRQTKEEAIEGYKKVAAEIEAVKNEAAARKPITFTNKDYTTYAELAEALFRREGIENPSKRQMEARIEDLKKTNSDLKDGELKGKRVTANVSEGMHERISGKEESAKEYQKSVADRKASEGIAKEFYDIADNNAGMNSMKKMQELLDTKVTKDNILDVLDAYDKYKEGDSSIIDTVTSEVGAGGTKAQKKVLTTILDKLCEAAEAEGVSAEDIKHAREEFLSSMEKEMNAAFRRTNPKDMEKAVDFLRGAIVAKQTGGEEITEEEAIAAFNEDFASTDAEAQKAYKDAREAEGWTAKAGDTVLGWFGCTTIEDMDKKLGDNADAVKRLAAAADNPEEFKAAYKEVFGVEFDKNKISARDTALGNYQQAQNLSSTVNITTEILKGAENKDYGTLRKEIKEKFQLDDETIDNVITSYAQTIGKEAETDADKRTMLMRFLQSTQENSRAEYQNLTKGKTLEQMGKDLDLLTKSAFGTKDIVKDVVQFNENQQTTEMVTEAAFEIAGTVALQFVPGLGQMAAARLAVSAAKWGTKAVKVANYAEKAFAATKNLQNMNKATQIGTQMLNAGAATMAVDLSNGKSVKEATQKALMNMSFAGVGASSSVLAPKLMQTFGITNRALANEIAEEIMNAAGTYGVTKLSGGEYGSQDAFIDFASGLIMSRISHVKGGTTPKTPDTPTPADPKPTPDTPDTPTPVDPKPTPDIPDTPTPVDPKPTPDTPDTPTPVDPKPTPDTPDTPTPVDPKPTPDTPDTPTPVDPKPTPDTPDTPTPVDPKPTPDTPDTPTPVDPKPTPDIPDTPTPVDPKPTPDTPDTPTPVDPKPTPDTPDTPTPVDPKPTPDIPDTPTPVDPKPTPDTPSPEEVRQRNIAKQEAGITHNNQRISQNSIQRNLRNGVLDKNSPFIEINSDTKLVVGDNNVIDFGNLSPELQRKIDLLDDGDILTIGRSDINPNDKTISGKHLVITKQDGKLIIKDTSTNGTKLFDSENFAAYNSLQQMRQNERILSLPEYRSAEKKFLKATGNDYVLLNNILSKLDRSDTTALSNILGSVNSNNKGILEVFANSPSGIRKKSSFVGTTRISDKELGYLMLFNRNHANAASLASSPSEVKKFLETTEKTLDKASKLSKETVSIIKTGTFESQGKYIKGQASESAMNDIETLIHGEDYIKQFKNTDSLADIARRTSEGDVAAINGTMFVNDGGRMVRLNLSEERFRQLFPPVGRFTTHQGAIGTCYLVATLDKLANTPGGRAKLYQLIGEDANGIYTTTANGNWQKDYFRRFPRNYKHMFDANGLAIIEQGYCKNAKDNIQRKFNASETIIMEIAAGGNGSTAVTGLLGVRSQSIRYDSASMRDFIIKNANNPDFYIAVGTRSLHGTSDRVPLNQQYNLYQCHEYSVKGYNAERNTVLISNPWHSGAIVEVPMDEFLKQFDELDFANLA